MDIEFVNSSKIPIENELLLPKAQEIHKYECNRITYCDKIVVKSHFNQWNSRYPGTMEFDSATVLLKTEIDSVKNMSDFESILSRQIGFAIFYSWISCKNGTNEYYWDTGVATWLAGKYYVRKENFINFSTEFKSILENGDYIDIREYSQTDKIPLKDRYLLNIESAAFIEYLVSNYGLDHIYLLSRELIRIKNDIPKRYFSKLEFEYKIKNILRKNTTPKNKYKKQNFMLIRYKAKNEIAVETKYLIEKAYINIFGISFEKLILNWLETI